MFKKIFLTSIVTLACSQVSIEAQMSISSVASLVKNIKNPALIAGRTLAAITTLAAAVNYYWINRSWANQEKKLCQQQNSNEQNFKRLSSAGCDAKFLGKLITAQVQIRDERRSSCDAANTQASKKLIKDQIADFSKKLVQDDDCSEEVKNQCEQIDELLNNDEDDYASASRHLQLIGDCDWYKASRHNKKENNEKEDETLELIEAINSTEEQQNYFKAMKEPCVRRDKAKLWSRMKLGYLSSLGLILYGLFHMKKA